MPNLIIITHLKDNHSVTQDLFLVMTLYLRVMTLYLGAMSRS